MEAKDLHDGTTGERSVAMPGSRLVTIRVAAERTGGACSLFEVEVGAGGGEAPHVQHREDECLYVVAGRFEFVVEEGESVAGPGSLVYVPKGSLHAFKNVGNATGTLLVLHTPGGEHERFVEEAGVPAAGPADDGNAPPVRESQDAGRLADLAARYGVEVVPAS